MKKILTVLFTVMTAVAASAQGSPGMNMEIKQFQDKKVDSGKEYYGDIPARITKVVVSGDNSMADLLFKNSVRFFSIGTARSSHWTFSDRGPTICSYSSI